MVKAAILAGLPPYGPMAISFPDPNGFREGLVVGFTLENGDQWVGNFERSFGALSKVHTALGAQAVIVIASGGGYVVDVERRSLVRTLAPDISHFLYDSQAKLAIVSNGLWFEGFDGCHVKWRTRRVSWDGVRNICLVNQELTGEAFSVLDERWHLFNIDITNGATSGGSYNGPD